MSPAPRVNRNLASMLFGPPASMLAAHKPKYAFRNYPLNVRPLPGERFCYWSTAVMMPPGEMILLNFEVPMGRIAVINRFAAVLTNIGSFSIRVDGIPDPVIHHVGHYSGDAFSVHEKDKFWNYQEAYHSMVAGNMLIDPILADAGSDVSLWCYSPFLTMADFAAGVSGFFCDRPEKWSMGR